MNFKKYIKLIFLTTSVLFFVASCAGWDEDDINSTFDESKNPETSFTQSETLIEEGNSITFTNTSTNSPKYFLWSFPGGNPSSSIEENPTVLYEVKGDFDVILKTRNEYGAEEVVMEKLITVEGKPIPWVSNYTFNGSFDDLGTNQITAVSNYGDPVYTDDRNGEANSSWQAPFAADQFLSIPNYKGIGGDNKRSVSAWFRINGAGTTRHTIVSWGVNSPSEMFNLMVDKNRIRVEAGACSLKSMKSGLDDDKWHHVAITYDPVDGPKLSDVKIYIDGVLNENAPDTAGNSYRSTQVDINTDIATTDVMIGQAQYKNTFLWNGELDDVRILDEVLLPAQIQAIYEGVD